MSGIDPIDPIAMLRPRRKVTGVSAILLPYLSETAVDWDGFDAHVRRTLEFGLIPAVNMDTGYANLIDEQTRVEVLRRTHALAEGAQFVAGVFVGDQPGAAYDRESYLRGIEQIQESGGTPIFFQSYGLVEQPDAELVQSYVDLASACQQFLFFELGEVFAPFGKIYPLEVYEQLMQIPNAWGAKHSSLRRADEWQRIALRDRVRPEFRVFTGNDLAVDMVMYGSDYLLGLSTFCPDAFALRDHYWATGDSRFYELNDLIQYLGTFAFRHPAPAYKHSAAMFLQLRGQIKTSLQHPNSPARPESDRPVLERILHDLEIKLQEDN